VVNLLGSTHLGGVLPPGLFALQRLQYLLVSSARFDGGLPQEPAFRCPQGLCPAAAPGTANEDARPTASPAAGPASTTSLPWLPQVKLLALVDCGLGGAVPPWVLQLPNASAIVLSGNQLSGPLPTLPDGVVGPRLTSFAAAGNRLSGSLAALRAAEQLVELDLGHNLIDGQVPEWLASRSGGMSVLRLGTNRLSCSLPAGLGINTSGSSGVIDVLRGNVFGCPVPGAVDSLDPDADTYACGSVSLTYAAAVFAVAVALAAAAAVASRRRPERGPPPSPIEFYYEAVPKSPASVRPLKGGGWAQARPT